MKELAPPPDDFATPEPRKILLEEEDTTDLRDYWFVIHRHRYAALIFFLSVLFLMAISVPWGSPLYTATATLYMQGQTRGLFDPESSTAGVSYQQTQRQLLKSRTLAAQVIKDLGLEDNPLFTQLPESPLSWVIKQLSLVPASTIKWVLETRVVTWIRESLGLIAEKGSRPKEFELGVHPAKIDRYLEGLTITPGADSYLVQVQFTSADSVLSKTVVNAHLAKFISQNLATRFELTAETRQFLESKLLELKAIVANSEKALNQFQRNHEIVSLDKGGGLLLDQLKKLNTDLTEARSRRIDLESLHRIVQKGDNQLLSQIIDNPTVQGLRKQVSALETQLAHLSTKFKPTYRGVIALQQEIDEAKSRLDQELNRVVQSIERDYRAATAKELALAAETQKARQVALNLQENAVEYAVLEREVASNRALYEAVFKKTKEAALTGEEPIPNLRVVDRAETPVLPDSSKATRILMLGIAAGLLGGIGLAFLLHVLDNTLKAPEDVARFIRLPTLGIVPDFAKLVNGQAKRLSYPKRISPPPKLLESRTENNGQLMVSHHPLSLMGEMYRSICTAILFSRPAKPPQTIMVTSAQPNEGKTVTAINIAMMLAQSSGPVLLIDADLRGGYCHKLLGLRNGNGLTNILTGDKDIKRFIKTTKINNLSLLGRGTLAPNPADLLGSERMGQTLDALSADFRFVVIDSAPLLTVTDTVLLSTRIDGVVLVARGGAVSRDAVRKARERLEYVKAKILGVVLNGVDISSAEYAEYRYIYRSHYMRYAEDELGKSSDRFAASVKSVADVNPAGIVATVPAGLVERIVAKLTDFVGPMAFIIVHDQVAVLGESAETFPRTRLEELIDAVAREISNELMRGSFRKQILDEIGGNGLTATSAELASSTLPPGSLERIVAKLTDFVGPMASIIVHDQIVAMSEAPETFPQSRLPELLEEISREIADRRMRVSFREQIAAEIRQL
jgi:capsular exopolysaccharide synthesis family protein